MGALIETFELTKRFSSAQNYRALIRFRRQEDLLAVDRVSLQIQPGEIFGLLGANGAGKTTLIRILSTLVLPTSGRALVGGWDIVSQSSEIRSRIGLVDCQERSFFWRLTGRQNLEFFAALHDLHGAQAKVRIQELLDLVDLSDAANQRFLGYSTGMRQRLAVARGLLAMPPIIFMDEPTRSLDPVNARDLRSFIRNTLVNKMGCTVLLVTHRLDEAEELCDNIGIMDQGKLLTYGSVQQTKNQINSHRSYEFVIAHLPSTSVQVLKEMPGVIDFRHSINDNNHLKIQFLLTDERQVLPTFTSHIISQGGSIESMVTKEASLEDAFVHLVGRDSSHA